MVISNQLFSYSYSGGARVRSGRLIPLLLKLSLTFVPELSHCSLSGELQGSYIQPATS